MRTMTIFVRTIFALCLFFIVPSVSAQAMNDSLICYNTFDDSWNALIGNCDFTTPDSAGFESGILNNGSDFSGSNYAYSHNVDFSSLNNMTITAWVNTTTTDAFFISLSSQSSGQWYGLRLYASDFSVSAHDGTGRIQRCWTTNTITGGYYFVAVVVNSTGTTLYRNAVEDYDACNSGNINTETRFDSAGYSAAVNKYVIGARWAGAEGVNIDGTIDEVGIWNRSLSKDEIEFLYNSGSPTTEQRPPFSQGDNCTPIWLNTSWSSYVNTTGSCLINDSYQMNSSRYLTQYDNESCPTSTNTTYWENSTAWLNCNYCSYATTTTYSNWSNVTCGNRTSYTWDLNYNVCCNITGLIASDCYNLDNTTYWGNYTTGENLSCAPVPSGSYVSLNDTLCGINYTENSTGYFLQEEFCNGGNNMYIAIALILGLSLIVFSYLGIHSEDKASKFVLWSLALAGSIPVINFARHAAETKGLTEEAVFSIYLLQWLAMFLTGFVVVYTVFKLTVSIMLKYGALIKLDNGKYKLKR